MTTDTNSERQQALEAAGWTFQVRNSQRKWVRYKSTSRRFARILSYEEQRITTKENSDARYAGI